MREEAPAVFPVFRSRLTAAVLARAYVGDGEYSVADLARAGAVRRVDGRHPAPRSLEPDLLPETAGAMIGASIRLLPDEPPSQNGNGV
jgi:glutathione S-transferase